MQFHRRCSRLLTASRKTRFASQAWETPLKMFERECNERLGSVVISIFGLLLGGLIIFW